MFRASRLLILAALVWIATTVLVAQVVPGQGATRSADTLPPSNIPSNPDYVGSDACAQCHKAEHVDWTQSLHIKMTKPVAEATIVGNFADGTTFADHGRSYEFGRKGGRPFMRIAFGDRAPETFTVDYTLGAKRYQGYLSTLEDGRMYVLPAFWHIEAGRWIDWKEITPVPDLAHDLRQIWNANCFNCHATNLAQGFDVSTMKYRTTWTEMGIGCEACHGPGRAHVAMMEAWRADPTQKPAYDKKIFSPESASPRQVFDTCAYCHGNKNNYFVGFRAGDRYEDYALPFLISGPIPENDHQGEFWPDGRPNRFNRPQALMQSGCFKAGAVACTNCHASHGSPNPFSLKVNIEQRRSGDLLCTQCHSPTLAASNFEPRRSLAPSADTAWNDRAIETHTFHKADSAGSRCIGCHMSDVNWRILVRRRDHTFQPPVPETTARFGVPNACTTCHDNRTPEWAASQMDRWWGDAPRRSEAARLADVFYRAGSGDGSTVPQLMRMSVDRSQAGLVRASAVDYLQQFMAGRGNAASVQSQTSFGSAGVGSEANTADAVPITPQLVNTLIGAAADPEPMVRASAVRALGLVGRQGNVVAALLARLVDAARVVRMHAAEALLDLGVVELPGRAGEELSRAQDEYVLGMAMFPDIATNQAALGWMQAERGRFTEAEQALDTAIALEPRFARPWVVKGVVAARGGRFAEAGELWRKAKSIEPAYPNIDRLIAEAAQRR